jgi:hypothetical protein
VVKISGSRTIEAKVGQPVDLAAIVTDDGVPKARGLGAFSGGAAVGRAAAPPDPAQALAAAARIRQFVLGPPVRITVGKNVGLHLSWYEYRGPASAPVEFTPMQIKVWEDTRAGANSPWAPICLPPAMPSDGKVIAKATFSQPGTYVLRALADDGALTGYEDVTVTVR